MNLARNIKDCFLFACAFGLWLALVVGLLAVFAAVRGIT